MKSRSPAISGSPLFFARMLSKKQNGRCKTVCVESTLAEFVWAQEGPHALYKSSKYSVRVELTLNILQHVLCVLYSAWEEVCVYVPCMFLAWGRVVGLVEYGNHSFF